MLWINQLNINYLSEKLTSALLFKKQTCSSKTLQSLNFSIFSIFPFNTLFLRFTFWFLGLLGTHLIVHVDIYFVYKTSMTKQLNEAEKCITL